MLHVLKDGSLRRLNIFKLVLFLKGSYNMQVVNTWGITTARLRTPIANPVKISL